jgi:hypothetical protein
MKALNDALPKETAAIYRVVGLNQGGAVKVFGAWGKVDFSTLTTAQADKLVADGFPYLERKPEPKKPALKPAEQESGS